MRDPATPHRPRRFLYWLLLVPPIATLWPPFYAHVEPRLFDIPFFPWYLMAWTLGCGVVVGAVHILARDGEP